MANLNSKKQNVFKEDINAKGTSGLDGNLAGALCYLAGFITGIIFLVIEKENQFVRFHAMQSILTFVAVIIISTVLSFIPLIGWILSLLIAPFTFVLWLFMMWKAYQGERFKLPFIGDMAEQQINK